ncbi:MAG TPA: hypothetical protein VFB79_03630, partial [Candidatus Angelobacter sp.]|nr:hypothetical protein [Candidatus Angelobacter sp.]
MYEQPAALLPAVRRVVGLTAIVLFQICRFAPTRFGSLACIDSLLACYSLLGAWSARAAIIVAII